MVGPISEEPPVFSFRIRGMDCAEEVAVLKRELGPLLGGEENLAFDLLHGRMTVLEAPPGVSAEEVRGRVARTGLEAVPWGEGPVGREGLRGWLASDRGRVALCAASGLFLVLGFVVQAILQRNLAVVLAGGRGPAAAVALYLASIAAGAWFVLPRALYSARALRPDMNLLMSVAIGGAMALGQWLEAASVAFLFALALLLERWSAARARRAIEALLDLSPATARVVDAAGGAQERPVEEVVVGSLVRVRPGEKVPLDGVLATGATAVDQAPITGESIPVAKGPGDEVFAGTVNGDGAFELRVTRPARDTTLARIIRMVEEAQSRRAPVERWVERFARRYTPTMMVLALAVALVPPLVAGGGWGHWVYQGLVMLVIACPCALVISTPVGIVAGLAAAARAGVLVKGGGFLELPAGVRVVALDKTGTVTFGRPAVQRLVPLNGHGERELLARAAALERESLHPMARAILEAAEVRGMAFEPAEAVTALPGRGAEGRIGGRRYWIGSQRLLAERRGSEEAQAESLAAALEDSGHTLVAVGDDHRLCGLIGVADEVRREAVQAVRELKRLGVARVVLLTGDNPETARAVAEEIGADEHRAELLPEDKVAAVEELAARWGRVAMVGDGVNDAPALAAADLGIAMGAAGSDAAIETADVALMSEDLGRLPWLLAHSRRTLTVIRRNIVFALGVKAVFIALAAVGAATLWMAIAADMGASLLVIANSLRLLRGPFTASLAG